MLDSRCPQCLLWLAVDDDREALSEASPEVPLPGRKTFGDFELLEEIARGGMGAVYKARQISLNRIVAVKMILAGGLASTEAIRRFRAEAEAAASLQHPNIVAIHEVGECDGHQFFSMDYVQGRSLAEVVREHPLPARQAAGYLKTIAEAVQHAHQRAILHRDLKPSNVLIDGSDQPRILDFGLAKRLSVESDLTLTGQAVGSPNFMPPEQAEGRSNAVGPASDVYSLGALLYHLITGRPPFQAETLTSLLKQVVEAEPVAPQFLDPNIPRDLETICLKCLEKEPGRRYGTARELAEELGRFLGDEPIQARPASGAEKLWRWCRRQPVRAGLIGALVMVFLLGLTGVLWQSKTARANELLARQNAYAAEMNLAQRALQENDLGRAVELLNYNRPNPQSTIDLRGWEWRYLWKLCQGDEQSTLCRYSNAIGTLALSPDGKFLAVRQGKQAVLWDLAARHEIATWPCLGYRRALAFSPDGKLIAIEDEEANSTRAFVNLWEVSTQRQVSQLVYEYGILLMAFAPDGKLATMQNSGAIKLWDSQLNRVMATNQAPGFTWVKRSGYGDDEGRGALAFSKDGAILAIGESQGRIQLWEWATGRQRWIPEPLVGNAVTALAFSPDGKLLVAGYGYADATVRLWDVDTLKNAGELAGHKAWVSALAFSPKGEILASASGDQTIRLWDLPQRRPLKTLKGHTHEVWSVAFAPDGTHLLSGGKDGSVRAWDPAVEPSSASWITLPETVWRLGMAFAPDSKTLYGVTDSAGMRSFPIKAWDPLTGQEKWPCPALGTNNSCLAVSPDGQLLAVGDMEGSLKVWDLLKDRAVTNIPTGTFFVGLAFDHGNQRLLSLAFTVGGVTLDCWEVPSWRKLSSMSAAKLALAWNVTPDCRWAAVAEIDGLTTVSDLSARKSFSLQANTFAAVRGVALLSGGAVLATGSLDGFIRLWDVPRHHEIAAFRGQVSAVHYLAASPDGRRLASGGTRPNEAVRLWDVATRQGLLTLEGEGSLFGFTGFSPDGNILVAVNEQQVVHLWRAPSWAEIEATEKRTLKGR